jgi:hypothetical protein
MFVLCITAVTLPQGKNVFAVPLHNNNNYYNNEELCCADFRCIKNGIL